MNSLERVINAVNFREVDRVPVIAQVGGHSAIFSGYKLIEYVKSGEVSAKSQIKALKYYGYDAVIAIFDACVESEAVGSKVEYRENIYPIIKEYVAKDEGDIEKLILPNPYESGRMPELLKSVSILKEEVGENTLVVGTIIGPMTIATQLMGIEKTLFLAIDNPELFEKLLDFSTNLAIDFAKAQIKSGAHVILTFEPSASNTLIPASFYREFVMARHKKLFKALKESGVIANWIHSAGKILNIMPYYKEIGADIVNFDYEIDPKEAMKRLNSICLDGNITPLDFIADNSNSIYEESQKLISLFKERGGFILSSGCEIPPEAKSENILAMVKASREFIYA